MCDETGEAAWFTGETISNLDAQCDRLRALNTEWKEQAARWEGEAVRLRTLNAELLAALNTLLQARADPTFHPGDYVRKHEAEYLNGAIEQARTAIAKAEQS